MILEACDYGVLAPGAEPYCRPNPDYEKVKKEHRWDMPDLQSLKNEHMDTRQPQMCKRLEEGLQYVLNRNLGVCPFWFLAIFMALSHSHGKNASEYCVGPVSKNFYPGNNTLDSSFLLRSLVCS